MQMAPERGRKGGRARARDGAKEQEGAEGKQEQGRQEKRREAGKMERGKGRIKRNKKDQANPAKVK